MSLKLVRFRPDPLAFARWSHRHRLLAGGVDDGYAWHALMRAALGDEAPQPFVVRRDGAELLAYTDAETGCWTPMAQDVEAIDALGLERLEARPFPESFQNGRQLSFEVRVRPVVRARTGRGNAREVDAAAHASAVDPTIDREAAYRRWLRKEFARDNAASTVGIPQMIRFRRSRVLRKDRSGGLRRPRSIEGPDAVFRGLLEVMDSEGFVRLVRRGLGRHRAFGFGCLLLAPPGTLR